jgi:dTDP-glucose 4,6-dehydratase/UDP-glucose 4-epimerase
MKILIIGSNGFIGRNCEEYFLEKNHTVYGCDIIDRPILNYFFVIPENPNYDPIFSQVIPDVCINASGSADVGFSLKNPEKDFELNVKNVEKILEAIRKKSPNCKLLNFSSAAVYGNPKSLPVKETAEINPLSPYGRHKLQSELLLKKYYNTYKLSTCSLRVFSAYGIGLKKQLFWDIYQKTLLGKIIRLFGAGNESRDFIFIDDLLSAIDRIIKNGKFSGEAINVSSGIETKIKDAAQIFLSFLGNEFILEFSGEEKAGDPKNWRADITILKQLGFTPFVTFDEGIKKYAEWLKENE